MKMVKIVVSKLGLNFSWVVAGSVLLVKLWLMVPFIGGVQGFLLIGGQIFMVWVGYACSLALVSRKITALPPSKPWAIILVEA
jgi:hypothetical protein